MEALIDNKFTGDLMEIIESATPDQLVDLVIQLRPMIISFDYEPE